MWEVPRLSQGREARQMMIRIAVLSRIAWLEGPPALKKNEKDFRDVCPRIGTVIGLRYLSRWNPVRMDTFGQSIIAVPQQPTVGK